eukprot:13417470-Heterocapsa_arctica.AAC.1
MARWCAALAALACAWTGLSQDMAAVVELPLKKGAPGGPFVAELLVGTPPQRIRVALDTASGE